MCNVFLSPEVVGWVAEGILIFVLVLGRVGGGGFGKMNISYLFIFNFLL